MQRLNVELEKLNGKKIVVLGDFMVDEYLSGDVSRVSPEAPVPVVNVQNRTQRLGGAGNVIRNLCALGAQVSAVSFIGNDDAGEWLMSRMHEYNVDVRGVFRFSDAVTGIKTRVTVRNQQLLRYDREMIQKAPKAFVDFLRGILPDILQGASAVIISDYGKGVITEETAQLIINLAKQKQIFVAVDPKGCDYSKYRGATICTPNMKELREATGNACQTEEEILASGLKLCKEHDLAYVLATRSEKGMSLINGSTEEKTDYPAEAKEVIDVTGAGDTVISSFTLCCGAGFSVDDACRISNLAASIVVSKFSAAVATVEEIQNLISIMENVHKLKKGTQKILTAEQMQEKAEEIRQANRKIVFTNGCFDIVHAGHISSFKQAKAFGDILVVGLNADASIRRIKGEKRPIVDQVNRAVLISELQTVDYVVIFEEDTPENLIRMIKPDVLVKGKDWEGKPVAGDEFVRSCGGEVKYIDLVSGLSTTNIINKILDVYGN